MTPERRLATLLAFAHRFEYRAMDDALDLLDLLITDIIHEAQTAGQQARLRTLRDLDAAALQLWEALQVLLDEQIDEAAVRQQTLAQIGVPGVISGKFSVRKRATKSLSVTRHNYIKKTRRCAVCDFTRWEGCHRTGQQNWPRHTDV
jgi:hypothetical protein